MRALPLLLCIALAASCCLDEETCASSHATDCGAQMSLLQVKTQTGAVSESTEASKAYVEVEAAVTSKSEEAGVNHKSKHATKDFRGYGGDVCFFVRGSSASSLNGGRERLAAIASTWGQANRIPKGGHLYYFIDEQEAPYHIPASIKLEQILNVPACDRSSIGRMEKVAFNLLNTPRFLDQCDWFALADDDSYVNMATVAKKARCVNPDVAHLLGYLYGARAEANMGMIVHGSMRLFSKAAVPLLAKAVNECPLGDYATLHPLFDIRIKQCINHLKLKELDPQRFGFAVLNNTRLDEEWSPRIMDQIGLTMYKGENMRCVDWVHKLHPSAMHILDDLISNLPECKVTTELIEKYADSSIPLHDSCRED